MALVNLVNLATIVSIDNQSVSNADNYQKIVRNNPLGTYAAIWPNVESMEDTVQWELIDPEPLNYQEIFGSFNIADLIPVARSRKRQIINQQKFVNKTILSLKEAQTAMNEGIVIDATGAERQLPKKFNELAFSGKRGHRMLGRNVLFVTVFKTYDLVRPSFVVSPSEMPDIWLYHSPHACKVIRFLKCYDLEYDFKQVKAVINLNDRHCLMCEDPAFR